MKDLLPEYSGIYYVLDENQTVWYIGQAKNIRKRWQGKAHHRIYQLESQKKYHFYIYYEAVNACDLNTVEKQRIQQYDPHLNESPVKTKKVLPAETLLRETISAISNFAFIVGVEDKHKIYICVDEECLKKIYDVQSENEKIALIKKVFISRKIYACQWENTFSGLNVVLTVHGISISINYWSRWQVTEDIDHFRDYIQTTLSQEPIKALTPESLAKICQQVNEAKGYFPRLAVYTSDLIKPLFNDPIDRESIKKQIQKISEDYKTGKRGVGIRPKINTVEELIINTGIDLQKYEGKFRPYPGGRISIQIQVFDFDFKKPPIVNNIVRRNDFKSENPLKLDTIYLLTGVDKQAWLIFEEYFKGFTKTAIQLTKHEGFIEKIYVSPKKSIVPAKANIKIESMGYSAWIPFGSNPEFPTFEAATTEFRRRLEDSNLPDFKITFKREGVTKLRLIPHKIW